MAIKQVSEPRVWERLSLLRCHETNGLLDNMEHTRPAKKIGENLEIIILGGLVVEKQHKNNKYEVRLN